MGRLLFRSITIQCFLMWGIFIVYGEDFCENAKDIEWTKKTNKPKHVSRYPGEWFEVDCRINQNISSRIELRQKSNSGSTTQRIPDGKKVINNSNVFKVTNLSNNDYGAYDCLVCATIKKAILLFTITEGRPFQEPEILFNRKPLIHFGEEVQLICEINGKYGLDWYKSGKKIYSSSSSLGGGKEFKKRKKLVIKHFNQFDQGLYTCEAAREIWTSWTNISLIMRDFMKPALLNFPAPSVYLKEGEAFLLNITVDGSPAPKWNCSKTSHDVCTIKTNKNIKRTSVPLKRSEDNAIFYLNNNVSFCTDNGTKFHCIATNSNGTTSKSSTLNILVKPEIHGVEDLKTIILSNRTRNLNCSINKANPVAKLYWTYSLDMKKSTKWSPIASTGLNHQVIVGEYVLHIKRQHTYKVYYKCTANNSIGEDSLTWEVVDESKIPPSGGKVKSDENKHYLIGSIVASVITVLVLVPIIVVLYKRRKLYGGFYLFTYPPSRDYISILDKTKSLQEQSDKLPYLPEWEFPRENITLLEELGSGILGVVYLADTVGIANFRPRAVLNNKKNQRRFSLSLLRKKNPYTFENIVTKTAVKTLKDNCSEDDLVSLDAELKILIHIGEHENILKVLGACTKGISKPLVILEYCPHGTLRDFLRSKRPVYTPEWHPIDSVNFSITDLVDFATQICHGMEYLIFRKCIHRDLAARNVLIGEGYVVKIADFGLARDVYENLEYVKKTSGLLPFKWMAIEAIKDRIFNEKTDVWSYGIVLWEMFTLGGTPYPGIDASELPEVLGTGMRMDVPTHCPERIGDIMKSCWHEDPEIRPSFSSISSELLPKSEYIEQHETIVLVDGKTTGEGLPTRDSQL